ncbi:MAG: glycosyltransferase family 39 protein, partial [Terriglobales bacterium]
MPKANQGRSEEQAAPEKTARLFLGLALGLTCLAYAGTLRFGFVYDDLTQIVRNPFLESWRYLPQYFTQHVWSHIWPDQPGIYYRPAFLAWLLLNRWLFGLDPAGWHLVAVLAHVACTALVWRLAQRLTGDRMAAAYAALIFGLHPVHVEGVAWVSGTTEPLMAALAVGSVLCWLRGREGGNRKPAWQAASLALFVLSMLVKETGIVVAGLVAVHAWMEPARQTDRGKEKVLSAVRAALPFVLLGLLYLGARRAVLGEVVQPEWPGAITVLLTLPAVLGFY